MGEARAAFLLYLAAAVFLAWPVSGVAGTELLTTHFDSFGHLWRAWLVERTGPLSLDWLRETDLLLYPHGANLPGGSVLQGLHGSTCTLALYALTRFLPAALAWNLAVVLALALTGTASFLLVREVTGSRRAAALGGLLLLTSPGYLEETFEGVLESTALFPLLLFLYFGVRWIRRRHRSDLAACGLLFGVAGLTSVYQGFVALVAVLAAWLWLDGSTARRGAVVLALLASLLAIGPGSLWSEASGLLLSPRTASEILRQAPDDPHRPGPVEAVHRVLRDSLAPGDFLDRSAPRSLKNHGLQPLHFFAVLGLVLAFPRAWPWGVAGLAFGLWALGPYVIRHGPALGSPAPAWLLYALAPPLAEIRPGRLWMAVQICAMVSAGWGLRVLLERLAGSTTRIAFVLLAVAALALVDLLYLPPFLYPCSTVSTQVPAFYERVRQDPSARALVEWPLFPASGVLWGRAMHAQTLHGKALVNSGMRGAESMEVLHGWIGSNGLLAFLVEPSPREVTQQDVAALADEGIRYVVVHDRVPAGPHHFFPQDREVQLFPVRLLDGLDTFLGPPAVREDGLLAWETRGPGGPGPAAGRYDPRAFPNAWVRFPASREPQTALLAPAHPVDGAVRVSFWFRCRAGAQDLDAAVVDRSGGVALAAASLQAHPREWRRVDLAWPAPARGDLALSFSRAGGELRTVELYRVEVTRP